VAVNVGIGEAGVGGGLGIVIDFNLYDPNKDNKVRLKELASSFMGEFNYGNKALAPLAIFDVSGKIYAELFAYLKIDLWFTSYTKRWQITNPITIADFSLPFTRVPDLAEELNNGDLLLNAGPDSSARMNGNTNDIDENFVVEFRDGSAWVSAPGLFGKEQKYSIKDGATLRFKGGAGNDRITVKGESRNINLEIDGGEGNDVINLSKFSGNGNVTVTGGAGNDTIDGADNNGESYLYGNAGDDHITAHGSAGKGIHDIIFGDDGVATAAAAMALYKPSEDGKDTLAAGSRRAIIIGGGGNDTITGGAANDLLIGDSGKVTFAYTAARVPMTFMAVAALTPISKVTPMPIISGAATVPIPLPAARRLT
jgi:hypothetical protein